MGSLTDVCFHAYDLDLFYRVIGPKIQRVTANHDHLDFAANIIYIGIISHTVRVACQLVEYTGDKLTF